MKIELASNQTVCPEPPRPPPLPPPIAAIPNTNGESNGQNSKTNTLNSTSSSIPAPPPPQDTATRKQQQPLSAISIQDLNSVQVNFYQKFFLAKTSKKKWKFRKFCEKTSNSNQLIEKNV